MLSYYCLFYLGAVVRELQKTVRTEKYHYWKMVVAFLILVLCNQIGSIALDENRYENPVFLLVVSICGWVLLYEVAQELKKKKLLADAIVCCGQNSMAIVVLHFLCFKIISLVGVVVYNQPREGIKVLSEILMKILTARYKPFGFSLLLSFLAMLFYLYAYEPISAGRDWKNA